MKKTYHGSCHCGWLRFEADIDLEAGTSRRLPVRQQAGPPPLLQDLWHRSFGEGCVEAIGGAFVSVNVACLDDIAPEELARVPIRYMDGRHDNWFQPPKVTSYL